MTDPDVIYTGAEDFSVHAWRISQQKYIVPPKGQLVNFCPIFLPPANKVCEGYVFARVCHSVRGGGVVSQHALQVSRPTPRGKLRGLVGGGVSRPTLGGVSQHALRQTPPTATAATGMHPTGMHSCCSISSGQVSIKNIDTVVMYPL